jgi:hypothetical protein
MLQIGSMAKPEILTRLGMAEEINNPATPLSQITRELALCRERVAQLESENAHLRASAVSFGQLAERLNQELQTGRQATADRNPAKKSGDSDTDPGSPAGSR